jgi:leucyl-tRNA synthetase
MILGQSYRFYALLDANGKIERAYAANAKEVVPGPEKGEWLEAESKRKLEPKLIGFGVELRDGKPFHPEFGVELEIVNEKMSKARGNVVNPDEVVREFGADSLRLYEMFMGPLERTKPWQTSGILGVRNFLDKVHNLAGRTLTDEAMGEPTAKLVHRTIKKVTEDIEGLRFNTAISQMMILVNHLQTLAAPPRSAMVSLLLVLSPFAPHLAEELWQQLGNAPSIGAQAWPTFEPALCQDDVIEMPVQINGKVRSRVVLARTAPKRMRALRRSKTSACKVTSRAKS